MAKRKRRPTSRFGKKTARKARPAVKKLKGSKRVKNLAETTTTRCKADITYNPQGDGKKAGHETGNTEEGTEG